MKRTLIVLFILLFANALRVSASMTDNTSTQIFDKRFRTLKTALLDDFMAPPLIRLDTQDRIVITFDEIGEEISYLEYRLIHCDADWQPSRLIESEYVDGFNSQAIEDFAYSYATYVHYVNYLIELPNDDMRILQSGNYLLQVYDPYEPDEILLQTRFQVSEGSADLAGGVTSRTDRGHNSEWQQLAMEINTEALGNINPYQDIFVDITQNMDDSTRRRLRNPQRVDGRRLIYDHQPELIFPASNEYRRFESVSNAFAGIHVDSLRYMGSNYHVWLKPDAPRADSQYSFDRTQHGRFLVREYNSTDSDIGADYITAHFLLQMPEMPDTEVYVDGEFTHGIYDKSNLMVYDPAKRAYTAEIPVKQGAYNYRYVSRPAGSGKSPSPAQIEGNKYETGNEYNVTVYFRPPGARADRIVGSATISF